MKQIAFAGAIMLALSGCRAPMPSFDLLAPYGTSRVPPPGTGSIGTGGNYYTPPTGSTTSPPVGTGFRPATINKWSQLDDPTESEADDNVALDSSRDGSSKARVVGLKDADVALSTKPSTDRKSNV